MSAAPSEGRAAEPGRAELRDLGFRPYVGARHAPSHNGWVMFRYGLVRAWASLVVKLALLLAFGPALIAAVAFGVMGYIAGQSGGQMPLPDVAVYARRLSNVQTWCFMTSVAVGAATSAIADDRLRGAFTFYFTKPLTQRQYLAGRASAIACLLAAVHVLPGSLFVALAAALGDANGLLPAARACGAVWAAGLVGAASVTAVALAVSSAGLSPALSAFGFLALWIVPHVGSLVAQIASEATWLRLVSLPALLATFSAPLFGPTDEVSTGLAASALGLVLVLTAGALWFAHDRIVRASRLS